MPWQKDCKDGLRLSLPCGRCIGCRLERSRQWAVRMMHEASLYDANCVVTLTYDDEHLPADGSLDRLAVPSFIRRMRRVGERVRYFQCGEYGDANGRPHYHGCLFGVDFADKVVSEPSKSGASQWVSPSLERFWPFGRCTVGTLSFESAAYVARYVCKKVTGQRAVKHYERVDACSGEVYQIEPEYATMSRRPGIGAGWFEKFGAEVYPSDEVIVRGRACKPPRYYDERLSEGELVAVKSERLRGGFGQFGERGAKRLQVREACTLARVNLFSRSC